MSQAGAISSGGGGGSNIQTLTGDTGGPVGPDASHNINVLGKPDILIAGNAATHTLQGTDLVKWTQFVVDHVANAAPYSTIQSAVTAAGVAGGGLVLVRAGTYTENLSFPAGVIIEILGATAGEDVGNFIINGIHAPAATGSIIIRNMLLQSATDIFNTAAAGNGEIQIIECTTQVTNGYLYNLPNWTGSLKTNDCGTLSTQDGVINNSGAATVFFNNSLLGGGSTKVFTANGSVRLDLTEILAPISMSAGSLQLNICFIVGQITLSGTVSFSAFDAEFFGGSSTAIIQNSATAATLNQCVIDSSAVNVITGTGTVNLGSILYTQSTGISAIVAKSNVLESGIGYYNNLSFDRGITTIATDGQLPIGKTGSNPQIGKIVSPLGTIVVSYLNPNITLEAATNFAFNYVQINNASSPYIVTATDYYIACDPTAGTITVKLPDAPSTKRLFVIKDRTGKAATNSISITTVGGAVTIDTVTTYTLSSNFESVQLLFNGTSYEVF